MCTLTREQPKQLRWRGRLVIAPAGRQHGAVASAPAPWPQLPVALSQFNLPLLPQCSRLAYLRPWLGLLHALHLPRASAVQLAVPQVRRGTIRGRLGVEQTAQIAPGRRAEPKPWLLLLPLQYLLVCRFSAPLLAAAGDRSPWAVCLTAGNPQLVPSVPAGPPPAPRGSRPCSWRLRPGKPPSRGAAVGNVPVLPSDAGGALPPPVPTGLPQPLPRCWRAAAGPAKSGLVPRTTAIPHTSSNRCDAFTRSFLLHLAGLHSTRQAAPRQHFSSPCCWAPSAAHC